MAKVTYTGNMAAFVHHNNPSDTDYVFQRSIPLEVTDKDAEHYKEEAKRGGPWKVQIGAVDAAKKAVKDVVEEVKGEPKKSGGTK